MLVFKQAWALAALALACGVALGQEGAPDDGDVLRGPSVVEQAGATLVRYGYDGKLERLDMPPAEAALELIALGVETSERIDEILGARAAMIDEVVREQFDVLLEAYAASTAGDQAKQSYLFQELMMRLAPIRRAGPLRDQIAEALPPEERSQYLRVLDEYWDAVIADGLRTKEAMGEKAKPIGIVTEEGVRLIFKEIERSIERQIGSDVEEFEELLRVLELRPEQEVRVRGLVRMFGEKYGLNATQDQKTELFWEIFDELDQAQRVRAVGKLFGGDR